MDEIEKSKEKELKKCIKAEDAALQSKTKETIEGLSDEQAEALIREKWISPIVSGLSKLPENIVNGLVAKLEALQKKYDTTFFEVEERIHETETSLTALLDELTGNEYDMQGLAEFKKLLGGE